MIDLSELKRLAEAAGGGKWHEKANTTCCVVKDIAGVTVALCSYTHNGTREISARQKAAFIAAANPAAILSLIERVETLESANASWVETVNNQNQIIQRASVATAEAHARGVAEGLERAAKVADRWNLSVAQTREMDLALGIAAAIRKGE